MKIVTAAEPFERFGRPTEGRWCRPQAGGQHIDDLKKYPTLKSPGRIHRSVADRIPHAGKVRAFKLLTSRGRTEKIEPPAASGCNRVLQPEDLDAYLARSKRPKRDHRVLSKQLKLSQSARRLAGLILWMPKGDGRSLSRVHQDELLLRGYSPAYTASAALFYGPAGTSRTTAMPSIPRCS